MTLWELANNFPLVEVEHTNRTVGAGEEGEEGVELVDTRQRRDRPALGEGRSFHKSVLAWFTWVGGKPHCVHNQLVA